MKGVPPTPVHSPQPRGADPPLPSGAAPRPSSSRKLHPLSLLGTAGSWSPAPSGSSHPSYPRGGYSLPQFPPGGTAAAAAQQPGSRRRTTGPPAGARAGVAGERTGGEGRAEEPRARRRDASCLPRVTQPRPGWRWQPPVLSGPVPPRFKSPPGNPPLPAQLPAAPLSGDDVASARHPHPGAAPRQGGAAAATALSPRGAQ